VIFVRAQDDNSPGQSKLKDKTEADHEVLKQKALLAISDPENFGDEHKDTQDESKKLEREKSRKAITEPLVPTKIRKQKHELSKEEDDALEAIEPKVMSAELVPFVVPK
jgi:hypothetical protein